MHQVFIESGLPEPLAVTKIKKFSIKYRASKLFNLLQINNVLPENISECNSKEIIEIYRDIKKTYILQNQDLMKRIFDFKEPKISTRLAASNRTSNFNSCFWVKKLTPLDLLEFIFW